MNYNEQSKNSNQEICDASNNDAIISSLFKLKAETEVPSESFWKDFDKKLEFKLQQHQEAKQRNIFTIFKSLYERIFDCKKYFVHGLSGLACCGFLMFACSERFLSHQEISTADLNLVEYNETFAMHEIDSAQVWKDTTLRFNTSNSSKYNCTYNDLCLSKGTSRNSEFLF